MKIPCLFKTTMVGVLLATLSALMLLPMQAAADDDVITWRVQAHYPQGSLYYKSDILTLKDRIAERTNGRLQLQVYGAGSLFPTKEIFNAVQRGIIPMGTVTPGYITNRSELAGIAFGLPSTFHDVWEAAHFFFNIGFEAAFREDLLDKHGVYWATTVFFPTELVVKKPINSIEDFRGLKIRSSGTLQQFLTETGASTSMIPGEEIYQALATGVVDGAHWGAVAGATGLNLYEVAKYHAKPPISIAANGVLINQKAVQNLPADVRKGLMQALREHVWSVTALNAVEEKILLRQAQEEQGVELISLPKDVLVAMNKAARKTWQQEASKGEKATEQVDKMKKLLTELGYL